MTGRVGPPLISIVSALAPRKPAPAIEPLPVVVIQFICLLGPAWKTVPPDCPNSQTWLTARHTPPGSAVRIFWASAPESFCQPTPRVNSSPFLLPAASYHEPPRVST